MNGPGPGQCFAEAGGIKKTQSQCRPRALLGAPGNRHGGRMSLREIELASPDGVLPWIFSALAAEPDGLTLHPGRVQGDLDILARLWARHASFLEQACTASSIQISLSRTLAASDTRSEAIRIRRPPGRRRAQPHLWTPARRMPIDGAVAAGRAASGNPSHPADRGHRWRPVHGERLETPGPTAETMRSARTAGRGSGGRRHPRHDLHARTPRRSV